MKTYRDFEIHPAANIFPLAEGDEFLDLIESIKKQGLVNPIVRMWIEDPAADDGRRFVILDGRNRLRACLAAWIEPTFCDYDGHDPIGYVMAVNLHRRHLNPTQRALLGAELLELLLQDGSGRSPSNPPMADRPSGTFPESSQELSREKAARLAGASGRAIQRALRVRREGSPELVKACELGAIALTYAEELLGFDRGQQRKVVSLVRLGEVDSVKEAVKRVTGRNRRGPRKNRARSATTSPTTDARAATPAAEPAQVAELATTQAPAPAPKPAQSAELATTQAPAPNPAQVTAIVVSVPRDPDDAVDRLVNGFGLDWCLELAKRVHGRSTKGSVPAAIVPREHGEAACRLIDSFGLDWCADLAELLRKAAADRTMGSSPERG